MKNLIEETLMPEYAATDLEPLIVNCKICYKISFLHNKTKCIVNF